MTIDATFNERNTMLEAKFGVLSKGEKGDALTFDDLTEEQKAELGNAKIVGNHEKRITNLEKKLAPEYFATDASSAHNKVVPSNACPFALVNKVGGMTYKTDNLIPFPYDYNVGYVKEHAGVKFTILADGGISIVGTPTSTVLFTFISADVLDLTNVCKVGKQYTISGAQTGILIVAHRTPIDGAIQSTAWIETSSTQSNVMPEGYKLYRIGIYLGSASVGTAINTVIYPMLNEGETAKPYSQFFKGLRDAKVTELMSDGANLIPFPYYNTDKTVEGVTYTVQNDGGIKVSGTPTSYGEFSIFNEYNIASFPKKITISVQGNPTNISYDVSLRDTQKNVIVVATSVKAGTDTVIDLSAYPNAKSMTFAIKRRVNNEVCSGVAYPMINYGTTAKPYRKYVGHLDTLPISAELRAFLDDKGYGRGVEGYPNYIDFERKVFAQKVNETDLGELTWRKHSDNHFITTSLPLPSKAYLITEQGVCLCSIYPTATWTEVNTSAVEKGIAIHQSQLFVVDKQINDLDTFVNAIKGEKICYELETPIETDISAYLTDENFIEVEGGGVIKAVNEHGFDAPTEIIYMLKEGGAE